MGEVKEKFSKLFGKNKNTTGLYIILIIGILIVLFGGNMMGGLVGGKQSGKTGEVMLPDESVEKRLEGIIAKIRGVGKVELLITYDSTGEKQFATDTSEHGSSLAETTSGGASRQEEDIKTDKKTITPSNSPVVTKEVFPRVKGVVAVAEGAENAEVRQNILSAIKAALDVADHKISILY